MEESTKTDTAAKESLGQTESRSRSLGRSRSRGRNPSELLARKQQLLSGGLQDEASWSSSPAGDTTVRPELVDSHRRSHTRRAEQLALSTGHQEEGNGGHEHRATSVETKLESLSELLKSHQQQADLFNDLQTPTLAKSIDDVYILLAKKEKDLQMAAELGKALLEKNDELSQANERITEDYSHKLELLEQDKHRLKRKFELLDSEYENRLIELQTDCNILKNQLDEQQQLARRAEKEKSKLIDDLVQQNQRLTSELVEATKSEELLSGQLEQMNERFNIRMSNRQDHVAQLDALKEEIQIVNQRKQDLERRLKLTNQDKSNLNAALDESGDKMLLLENLLNEKDAKLNELMEEVHELSDSNSWLSNELESMISLNEKLATTNEEQQFGRGLESELAGQRKRSQLIEQLKELRLKKCSRLKATEFMLISRRANGVLGAVKGGRRERVTSRARRKRGDASLFDEIESSSSEKASATTNRWSANDHSSQDGDDAPVDEWEDKITLEIYVLLRRFHTSLQHRKDAFLSQAYNPNQHLYSPNSAEDSGISADDLDKASSEQAQAKDSGSWKQLLTSLKSLIEEMPCSTCQLMIAERADYEQLQKLHAKLCDEMRRKNDELLAVSVANTEQETKLAALEERCAILSNDLSNCDKPKEEIVKLAWKARDEAVERKNGAEISLAKTRIENMQITSQLMEVVQQKGDLSQKLAQFEDDIHYITQDSVKAKFTWEEYAEKLRRANTTQSELANNSNPLTQLLSFSVASSRDINGANTKSSTMDNITQPTGLMRNFTSNRFNLRFWQRNSCEKAAEKVVAGNSNDLITTNAIEQKAS